MDEHAFEAGLSFQVDRQVTEQELKQRRENFEKAKAKAHALPLNPGCYLMKDESGAVIYVGKPTLSKSFNASSVTSALFLFLTFIGASVMF